MPTVRATRVDSWDGQGIQPRASIIALMHCSMSAVLKICLSALHVPESAARAP